MEYLRQIEEDIRGLGAEAKVQKKYPEVKDATERALVTLKTMREMYVADKMRKSGGDKVVKFPQSSDVSAPYILACNYADANPKMLLLALSGIQMLVNYEVVPPGDVKNILRVFSIQAAAGKPELQLKLLQILLQLANSLSQNASTSAYLTEATICSFLTLALTLCDLRSTLSVSSTAFATARQIIAIVMEGTCGAFRNVDEATAGEDDAPYSTMSPEKITESFSNSAQNLLKDLSLFISGKPGELMRGILVQPTVALDLLDDILIGWKDLFWTKPAFRAILKDTIYVALKPLLKGLQDDFANSVLKNGLAPASSFTSRVVRLARSFLLHFSMPELMDEVDVIVTLMIHSLQPDRSLALIEKQGAATFAEEASSMVAGAGSLISRLNIIPGLGGLGGLAKPASANGPGTGRASSGGVGLQGSYLVMTKSHGQGGASSASQSHILAHPAGACLETLLSFFSSDLTPLLVQERGPQLVASAITNTILSISAVICGGLVVEANSKDFDATVSGSQFFTLLEGLFTSSELPVENNVRTLHEFMLTTLTTVSATDLLLLSVELMQVVVRLMGKLTLTILPRDFNSFGDLLGGLQDNGLSVFLSKSAISSLQLERDETLRPILMQIVSKSCNAIFESIQETCMTIVAQLENHTIIRRSLGVLAETALIAGIFGLQVPCDSIISVLSRMTVPAWHDLDVPQQTATSSESLPSAETKLFRWRHVQATVRLSQVIHVLADIISDWDVIVDAFEQIMHYLTPKALVADDVTSADVDKVSDAINRFRHYTVYLSDDSLIKLMASLVAMSLNNFSIEKPGKGEKSKTRVSEMRRLQIPSYLAEGVASGVVGLSLQAAIEVTKYNAFRVSCVWQMVTSHLRILSTMKNDGVRFVAVAATHDMIATTLEFMQTAKLATLPSVEHIGEFPLISQKHAITDDFIFHRLVPNFEACLLGSSAHKLILPDRVKAGPTVPTLSQSDLFSSLKALSSARQDGQDDVRQEIVEGLLKMLQGGGEAVNGGGWAAIIDLVATVPASMKPDSEDDSASQGQESSSRWPLSSLATAFNCVKLVLDEFMDLVPTDAVVLVVTCLGSFALQIHDVNISLTALEMLWKVYDHVMRDPKRDVKIAQSVFDVTMKSLLGSSLDQRPEIRHCAMNTLFAALTMTANASLTTGSQWKQVFDDVIFPLFQRAGDRSKLAAETNEAAIAPELKKGKKMTLHHSRDTAHKQWSETRVLALKGLARVIKTCTWLLLKEPWFRGTWTFALEVCSVASQAAHVDQEVALTGLDVMFTMLKVVSTSANKAFPRPATTKAVDTDTEATLEISREALWQLTWAAVNESAKFECPSQELALHICQNMLSLYSSGLDAEFKYSENVRILCETLVTISRPRLQDPPSTDAAASRANKVAEVQLQRAVSETLRTIRPVDIMSLHSIVSAYTEIAFASHCVQLPSPFSGDQIFLESCSEKLRLDVSDFIVNTMLNEKRNSEGSLSYTALKGAYAVILDVVFRRFSNDFCEPALALRTESVDFVRDSVTEADTSIDEEEVVASGAGSSRSSGFFSWLSQPTDQLAPNKSRRKGSLGSSLHTLQIYVPPAKANVNTWTTFYALSSELNILVSALETCSIHLSSNGRDDISDNLKQKVLSSLLCILSPWRVHELPAARNAYGSVITSDEAYSDKLLRLIDLIYARGLLFEASGWIPSLIQVLSSSVRMQVHAISKEAELVEFGGQAPKGVKCILHLWSKISKIFAAVITESHVESTRRR